MKQIKISRWIPRLVGLLFTSALLVSFITPSWVLAQSATTPWTKPVNLSQSGGATNPSIVSDSEGVVHAIWQDSLMNFAYSQFDGNQWSAPVTTDLGRLFTVPVAGEPTPRGSQPWIFTGPDPTFIAGPNGYIFAFWISPQGRLFEARVRNTNFQHFAAWEPGGVIANQASSFAVAVDGSGEWHLAYTRTISDPILPAGVYYTHSRSGGIGWPLPVLLYQSPYLTHLGVGEANLSVATAETDGAQYVYVAWDNRPRKQVFLTRSADGGKTWDHETSMLISGPAPDAGLAGPLNIQVGANQNNVVLTWQSGHTTNGTLPTCSQIYQSSSDGGATWGEPQPMIENLLSCSQSNKFVTGLARSPDSILYFLTETKSQVFLSAWNGHQWSQPQEQSTLSGFEEPEIYTPVTFGCHQAALLGAQLYVVGCDQGDGGDIWVTSRDLGSNASWFEPPVWSQPSPVATDSYKMEAVDLLATDDGNFHIFFNQQQDRAIYYTYSNGGFWSRVAQVLQVPEGDVAVRATATGIGDELFLIAQSNKGMLYYSRATSGEAATQSSWSPPTRLEVGHNGEIGSADLARDASGTLYLAYSVPVNNDRGIYLVQSKDRGATWSQPLQVFDGAAAGFDLVGAPTLLISENGSVQLIWKRQSIQGDGVAQSDALYYSQSTDGGATFSDATPVVKEPVAWQEILRDGKGNLHLLWQPQDTLTTVWDQVSQDKGATWQYPQGLPDTGSPVTVITDAAGRLHLVGVGTDSLGHWLWDGGRWQSEAALKSSFFSQKDSPVQLLAAASNKQGKMMVVLAQRTGEAALAQMTLHYSTSELELPSVPAATQKAPTKAAPTPTLTPATVTPEPLLTSTVSADNPSTTQTVQNATNGTVSPLTMALFPVGLLLLSVLGIVIWRVARAKDR